MELLIGMAIGIFIFVAYAVFVMGFCYLIAKKDGNR